MKALALAVIMACGWTESVRAAADEVGPSVLSLDGVRWFGPAVRLEQLRGKTVVVLIYASWCPKCNSWSGELFTQLKQAIEGQPTVILAIYADKNPEAAKAYLAERNFFAPNIVHGYDASLPQKLGFQDNLFHYVLVDASGTIGKRGAAGAFFGGAAEKKFAIAAALASPQAGAKFTILAEGLSEPVRKVLWPFELGMAGDESVTKGRAALRPDEKKELDAAIGRFMDAGLEQVQRGYKGDVQERLAAYEKASQLAGTFKSTPQSKKAREVAVFLEKDEKFKRELAAKKAYEACLNKGGAAAKRDTLLKSVAKRFEGTYYGQRAAQAAGNK